MKLREAWWLFGHEPHFRAGFARSALIAYCLGIVACAVLYALMKRDGLLWLMGIQAVGVVVWIALYRWERRRTEEA